VDDTMPTVSRLGGATASFWSNLPGANVADSTFDGTPQSKGYKDLKIQLAVIMLVLAHVGPKIKIIRVFKCETGFASYCN
jgi:hypothetical protein